MTRLSTALNSSLSGFALAGRMTQTISNNVANALTEGYAARQVVPAARLLGDTGSGVTVGGVVRNVDTALLAERRFAEAEFGLATIRADFYGDVERAIGLPDDPGALSNLMAGFDAALINAASRPESDASLTAALKSAQNVANKLNSASDTVQQARVQADQDIAQAVEMINQTLKEIAALNVPLPQGNGNSEARLNREDQRQTLIDQIAEYIPVRELPRENGTVTLFTPGGTILLDGRPAVLDFSPVGVITPDMSLGSGALSGLTINGTPVSVEPDRGRIPGGKLAALFDIRDTQAVDVQEKLDAVARDLIERFEDPAVDPTRLPTDPGLFTDNGLALVPADEVGLAQRIAVNALVDPAQGGAVWRLRDGVGAAAPGNVGNANLLNALSTALNTSRVPASGGFSFAASAAALSVEVTALLASTQSTFAQDQAFAKSRSETLISAELERGVDTDQEMQRLLLVEQAYAANARVIATIDDLFEQLLRI